MKRRLSTKMILRIWGSAMLLLIGLLAVNYYYINQEVKRGVHKHSLNLTDNFADNLEGRFRLAAAIPRMMALHLESQPFADPEDLRAYMRKVLQNNAHIYGTCIAYEPGAFAPDLEFYAPYYYMKDGEPRFAQLGNETYNYFKWDWYKLPKQAGHALWSEPYFDTGGGNALMITHSVPFLKDKAFAGIVTIDLALDELTREVSEIKAERTGYGFLVSRKGQLIAYPDKTKIMKTNITALHPELARRLAGHDSGMVKARDPLRDRKSWIFYHYMRSADMAIVVVYPVREVMARVYNLEKTTLWLGFIGLCALFLLVALISKAISRPIAALAAATNKVAGGDLDVKVPRVWSKDEVQELTETFNKMVVDLRKHIKDLQRTTAEKERISSELNIARDIQMSILPRTFPPFPKLKSFDIFARAIPAREMGGDFYDFFLIDDHRLGFVIADVSEKGVPAALFMAISRTLIKANALQDLDPGTCLTHVNDLLIPDNESSMFVTLFYGILDLNDGKLAYANAGHNPPLLMRQGKVERLAGIGCLALGAWEGTTYPTHHTQLEPCDTLFCYTDGITEAQDGQDRFFTEERLVRLLGDQRDPSAEELIESVVEQVKRFTDDAPQFDDITALALLYRGQARAEKVAPSKRITIVLDSEESEVQRLQGLVDAFSSSHDLPAETIKAISSSLEQVLGEMVADGEGGEVKHSITVRVNATDGGAVQVEIEEEKAQDAKRSPTIPEIMDNVEVQQRGGRKVLVMTKRMDDK